MSESLFGDLDIAGAEDNPWGVSLGVQSVTVSSAKAGLTKAGDKKGLTLIYTVTDGDDEGEDVQEWKWMPEKGDESKAARRARSFIKMRLNELGIPEDRHNTVTEDDLVGIDGYVTLTQSNNPSFPNVRSFSKTKPDAEANPNAVQETADSNPFARSDDLRLTEPPF